eukprot:GSMAST32.ASY1.ANO1.100.1 assembled CDS
MKNFKAQAIDTPGVIGQVSKLFHGHNNLILGFNTFLPPGFKIELPQVASGTPAPPAFDKAVTYVTRIKERFSGDNSGTYKAFLDILHTYQKEQRSIKDVLDKVADLFKHHPDLLEEFTYFLPDAVQDEAKVRMGEANKRTSDRDRRHRRKHLDDGYHLPEPERRFFQRVKSAIGKDQWVEFIKCLELFCQEVINRQELLDLVWFSMPLSEIDFNNCQSCTPSYRALPEGYPIPVCSDRTPEMMPFFNDCWVSVPTGSEDFAFKNSRKNVYEEALFRCEDERYEIDMVIEANLATIRLLEPLALDIQEMREKDKANSGENRRTLSVTHLKAIARIYADHGHEILELLRKNPAGAIPIVLKRLKQKDVEWKRVRKELENGWREVLKKNYAKSLDHRSFYFRQQDKKQVTTKYMLSDLKSKSDRQDKRRHEDASASASGPHFSVKLPDFSVHRDVYALLRHGTLKMGSLPVEGKKKVAELWRTFVQPLLGFPIKMIDDKFALSISRAKPKKTERVNSGDFVLGNDINTSFGEGKVSGGQLKAAWKIGNVQKPHRRSVYGNSTLYLFVRLYYVLYDRISKAKQLCSEQRKNSRNFVLHPIEEVKSEKWLLEHKKNSYSDYTSFLTSVCNLLDGTIGTTEFEGTLKNTMGSGSFVLFTVDKLIQSTLKQLHSLATGEKQSNEIELARSEGITSPYNSNESYRAAASRLLENQEEDAYRLDITDGVAAKEGEESVEGDVYPLLQKQKLKAGLPQPLPDEFGPKYGWREPPTISFWYKPFTTGRQPKPKEKKDSDTGTGTGTEKEKDNATRTSSDLDKDETTNVSSSESALLKFGSSPTKNSATSMDVDESKEVEKDTKSEKPERTGPTRRPRRGAAVQASQKMRK